jgi:hypothetical protein
MVVAEYAEEICRDPGGAAEDDLRAIARLVIGGATTLLTSERLNSALKVLVAVVWRALPVCVAAVLDGIKAVESSAAWNATLAALARE